MPNSYQLHKNAERELKEINKSTKAFIRNFNRLQATLDLSKFDELAPEETHQNLLELRKRAVQIKNVISGILSEIRPKRNHRGQEDQFAHGNYGRLMGTYNPIRRNVEQMINHLDFLLSVERSSNRQRKTIATIAASSSHIKDDLGAIGQKDITDGFGVLFGIIGSALLIYKRFFKKTN